MFEIDLEKYYPENTAEKTLICNIRKRPITNLPEEIIRQAFVKYLIEEKGVPIDRIGIEIQISKFREGISGRVDLLIFDELDNVLCLIEVKRKNEIFSDRILDQVEHYEKYINPLITCIVIGHEIYIPELDEDGNLVWLNNFPTYKSLLNGLINEEYTFEEEGQFLKLENNKEDISYLIENAIIGEDTNCKYHNFLIKLCNLYYNDENVINFEDKNNIDLGLKTSKFGNAGGGVFFGEYRSFHNEISNKVVSLAVSSMTKGDNYPTYTSLMFAVEKKGNFHHSLQLRVDKNIHISGFTATITHDASITVGKLGAAKKSELFDFINLNNPNLIENDKVLLGILDYENEIDFNSINTKKFIKNCISYALLRDDFRAIKKGK